MSPFPNLISNSLLINATIGYLNSTGGKASAVRVVDRVMKIRNPERTIARLLVSDLVERDSRLRLTDDIVEFINAEHDLIDLSTARFVILDLETTGAKAPPRRVTEIGAFKVQNGAVVDKFQTLVNPEARIPPFITSLTGISEEMVKDAPKFREVADDFLRFLGDSVIVAHNSRFDLGFLDHEIGRIYEDY